MFETAELGQRVSKEEYRARVPELRQELLEAQGGLREAKVPAIVLFGGVDGAGKGETANLLNAWMDPHWIVTHAFDEPTQEERERPPYWRYWRALPPAGHMGVFLSAWYSRPLLSWVNGKASDAEFDAKLARIASFERMLADDGALITKFWMHLSKSEQKRRFRKLEADPDQAWRVTKRDWEHFRLYDRFMAGAERIIARTSAGHAPWTIVEGVDENYRSLRVGSLLLASMQRVLARGAAAGAPAPANNNGEVRAASVLGSLAMDAALDKDAYREKLAHLQGRLNALQRKARAHGRSTIVVFEGWDAAGKGGAIRRITAALDARDYTVNAIAAPTDEERAHHYLWRFWRHLPRAGRVAIFDRSWYGRLLVERVEGFATEQEWRRAYAEIRDFERQLHEHGTVLVKIWLHITPEEQERRFRAREETPYKRWKLTPEDWRNRERWGAYERAVDDMMERTSTREAPWTLVEGNDKRHARIRVLRTLCAALEEALD